MLSVTAQRGVQTVARFLAHRDAAGISLAAQGATVAETAAGMARRFRAGGRLLTFGNGNAATDAAHLAVEFMHPVIVGKPAIPAIALTNDVATVTGVAARAGFGEVYARQVRALGHAGDVALAISADPDCRSIAAGLGAAREMGLLTVLLTGSAKGDTAAEYVIRAEADDPALVKEIHVTVYHMLWELVHVLLVQDKDCGEVCVTCSDQATPAEVLRIDEDGMALARVGETVEPISVALVDTEVGGTVLVHAGEAIGVLPGDRDA